MNINPQAASLAQKDVQQAAMTQADINDGVVAQDCASSVNHHMNVTPILRAVPLT